MVNRTIKNFEIKELIATGGMAAIYKAIQVSLERIVAIKILHGHLAQDKDFITRFEREAKAAANLKHENIVNIIDYGKVEDIYFIAMEYVEGKSLKDLINSVKFMPPEIALLIAYEISQGLIHAHQKGVVHRDIKPANILLGYDGVIKIADFGLAQAQDLTSITVTGSIVGTPAYMSPEQAGGKKVDHRSDIFSLGVVLYEMITGNKPFHGENYSSIIHEILTVVPPKPFEANPLIAKDTSGVIERMLEKDPEQRYQNITEVSDDISLYLEKAKIGVVRKDVSEFIRAPAEHFQNLLQTRKEKHLERGLHFMSLGDAKIDEAIGEFDKILQLDPENLRAKKYLSELKEKKERKRAAKEKKSVVPVKKKISIPVGIIIGVLVLGILLFAFYKRQQRGLAPVGAIRNLGIVKISSTPDGAAIYFDNKELNLVTPAILDSVSRGEHQIELRKTGYKPFTEKLAIKGGDTVSFNPVLLEEQIGATYGRIIVESKPPGASVFLDDIDKGLKTPCTIEGVGLGQHKIKLVKPNFQPVEITRSVTSNKPLHIFMTLKPTSVPVVGTSFLKINVDPWAKIYIDDRYIETTPIAGSIKVPPGTHSIKLENPNFKIWQKKVPFKPGETVNLDVKLEPIEGFLKLTVKPWADVYLDGKFYETTPIAEPIKLSAGRHILKLINPSFQMYEEPIEIPSNKMLKKYVELVPK